MGFSQGMDEAKKCIMAVDECNEGGMKGSPILKGKDSSPPDGKGELTPKTYTLVGDTKEFKRTL